MIVESYGSDIFTRLILFATVATSWSWSVWWQELLVGNFVDVLDLVCSTDKAALLDFVFLVVPVWHDRLKWMVDDRHGVVGREAVPKLSLVSS